MCFKYGKMFIVEQCIYIVVGVIQGSVNVDEKMLFFLFFFCGSVLIDQSEYVCVIEYFEMLLLMRCWIYGNRYKVVVECLCQLGWVSFNFLWNEDVMKFYYEVFFIFCEICGEKSVEVVECLVGLGNVKGNFCFYVEVM